MAIDEGLAERVREQLIDLQGVSERRMFGGLVFMINEHMCVGLVRESLMVRVGPDAYEASLQLPQARPMDFTGKPLRGFVYVEPEGIAEDEDLAAWIERGIAFAGALPPKEKKPKPRKAQAKKRND